MAGWAGQLRGLVARVANKAKRRKTRNKAKAPSLNARFPKASRPSLASQRVQRLLEALEGGERLELAEAVVRADELRDELAAKMRTHAETSFVEAARVLTTLMALRPAPAYLHGLAHLASIATDQSDPEAYLGLLYAILRYVFTLLPQQHGANTTTFYAERLWPPYLRFLERSLGMPVVRRGRESSGGAPRLAIVVPQLLAPSHAPTGQALEFAAASMRAGYDVLLCDAELMPTRPHPAVINGFIANRRPREDDEMDYDYDGLSIPHFRAPAVPFSRAKVAATVDRVLAFDPDVVLSQNVFNFAADKLASVFPTVFVPTGHTMAASLAHVYIAAGEDQYPDLVAGQHGEYVLPRYLALHTPVPEDRLGKEDLQCTSDDFVYAVVGNRLAEDLKNADFLGVVDRLCARCPSVRLVQIGGDGENHLAEALPHHASKFRAHAADPNLRRLYAACDGFLNPFRPGGGVSAHIATLEELPVLSLRDYRSEFTLDVSSYVHPDAWSRDPEEFGAHAIALATDPGFHSKRVDLLRAHRKTQPLLRDDFSSLQEILDLARERFVARTP